jgi:hypothetical protein
MREHELNNRRPKVTQDKYTDNHSVRNVTNSKVCEKHQLFSMIVEDTIEFSYPFKLKRARIILLVFPVIALFRFIPSKEDSFVLILAMASFVINISAWNKCFACINTFGFDSIRAMTFLMTAHGMELFLQQ